jgi:hypothetical protein
MLHGVCTRLFPAAPALRRFGSVTILPVSTVERNQAFLARKFKASGAKPVQKPGLVDRTPQVLPIQRPKAVREHAGCNTLVEGGVSSRAFAHRQRADGSGPPLGGG